MRDGRAKLPRYLAYAALALCALLVLAAVPVVWNETACVVPQGPAAHVKFTSRLDPADRRDEIGTYYTYPEWAIVFAYADLAGVTRAGSESDFHYLGAVNRYWTSLCGITTLTSKRTAATVGSRAVLYVIGLSFTAEMVLKGAYERTIGAVTATIRGKTRTPEDDYALGLADDYAKFLETQAWYDYPFGGKLKDFWAQTPLTGGNPIRKIERRFGLTLEWGGKAVYAAAMRAAAGAAMPFSLRIRSVVSDLDPSDLAADQRIALVKKLADGASIVETDRYVTLTDIVRKLALRGRHLTEIAGNSRVLISVLVAGPVAKVHDAAPVFVVPVQSKQGWNRLGIDVDVAELTDVIQIIDKSPAQLELIYDFY